MRRNGNRFAFVLASYLPAAGEPLLRLAEGRGERVASQTSTRRNENDDHKKDLMPNEIASTLGTTRPNVTVMINGLLEKGLINEEQDPDDKRRKRLSLTDSGLGLLQGLQEKREKLNSELFAGFSPEEMEKMIGFIEKFIVNIENGPHEV